MFQSNQSNLLIKPLRKVLDMRQAVGKLEHFITMKKIPFPNKLSGDKKLFISGGLTPISPPSDAERLLTESSLVSYRLHASGQPEWAKKR